MWSGAIATAHEKHCIAQASLTCSMFDDSCVRADKLDSGNSCNKLPPCLAAVSTVHQLNGAVTERAAKTSSHGYMEKHDSYLKICFIAQSTSDRDECRTWVGAGARPFFFF